MPPSTGIPQTFSEVPELLEIDVDALEEEQARRRSP
jgi:hypothetical protein